MGIVIAQTLLILSHPINSLTISNYESDDLYQSCWLVYNPEIEVAEIPGSFLAIQYPGDAPLHRHPDY